MPKPRETRYYASLAALAAALVTLAVLITGGISCGGNSSGPTMTSNTGSITTSLSDPPTCAAPNGQFMNVWVTITKVTANVNGDAQATDNGWVTLVDLTAAPKQIDLLSLASTTCALTQLGSATGLTPGNYQQIRLFLLDNSATGVAIPSPNNCGATGFNCVVLTGGATVALNLSSEAQTGLKIPPGQISGGGINLMAGQSADLNLDFNACTSIVQEGNGQVRLKPALHAGEVALNQNSISGTVVDSATKTPVAGAMVLVEQPQNGIDTVMASGLTDSSGNFIFCPLPAGNYDVVVAALAGGVAYNATVTFQVPLGTALTSIPLVAETGVATGPGTITGLISTTTGSAATAADVSVIALQSATPPGGSAVTITVPAFAGSSAFPLVTGAGALCPATTDCATFSLIVPASNPSAGTFSTGGTTYSTPAAGAAAFSLQGEATTTTSTPTTDCSPATVTVTTDTLSHPLAVLPGASVTAAVIAFTGCQ
ncbi:MAG TPA: DUF4382 domain-containing protein [Terriglobia bacterium]|nr:DUF4382 domain-containing protein [Terriglobia bacterium]